MITESMNDQERHLECHSVAYLCRSTAGDLTETARWLTTSLYRDQPWKDKNSELPAELPEAAPRIMQHLADHELWLRIFGNEEPGWYALLIRKFSTAYYLFRAVVHTQDEEAKKILFDAGVLTLKDIVDLEEKRAD